MNIFRLVKHIVVKFKKCFSEGIKSSDLFVLIVVLDILLAPKLLLKWEENGNGPSG